MTAPTPEEYTALVRRIWRELTTPSDFARDWYGWATNQMGHFVLGAVFACAGTILWYWLAGEFPRREWLFVFIGAGYLAFELCFQKWQGWDTVEDWLFVVAYGAGAAISSVTEREAGSLTADIDVRGVAWAMALAAGHLAVGVGLRLRRAK